jgi:hypothetical protein
LILKRILVSYRWGSSNHQTAQLAFLSAHICLYCVVVSCAPRSVAVRLNICFKLVRNTTFSKTLQLFSLISKLRTTQFDGP